MSPAGVNYISPPNDGGWVSSPSMVSIDCSKSHSFLTRSSSWKGRDAGSYPVLPLPLSMWWPPTIMAVIGVTITATGNAVAVSDTMVALDYGPVKWVAGCVDIPMCYRPSPKSMPNGCFSKNDVIGSWMTSYAIIVLMTETTRSPKAKAWIGSPIIVVHADPSDVSLNKMSPTGNGRNPWCMLMMNRTLCGLGIPCPRTNINSDFFPFSQTMPLTIYTGGAKGVDTDAEHLCHKYGHWCVVFHLTLSPSSQVPRALVPARVGRRHAVRHLGRISIRSTCLPSHHPPVFTTQLSRDQACVLSARIGVFWWVMQACVGRYGMECGHGSTLIETPVCVWFGYGTVVLVESHLATISTLWRHDRGTDTPSHITRQNSDCRHPRRRQGGLSHLGRIIPKSINKKTIGH